MTGESSFALPRRVLIVDNQRGIRRALRSTLESFNQGFEIHEATSGEEAILALPRLPGAVELLITDVRLAGISGLDLTQRLRQYNPGLKVILTAVGIDEAVRQQALQAQVNALLPRPAESSELIEAVQRCLGQDTSGGMGPGSERSKDLGEHLEALQKGMAAQAALLLDTQGQVLARAGDGSFIGGSIIPAVLEALGANTRLARALGGAVPDDLLCLAGPKVELFAGHIGEAYALLAVFDPTSGGYTRARATRLVTAAVQDLAPILPRIHAGAKQEEDSLSDESSLASPLHTPSLLDAPIDVPPDPIHVDVGDKQEEEFIPEESSLASPLLEGNTSLADLEAVFQQASLLHFDPTDVDDFWEAAIEQQEGDSASDSNSSELNAKSG